MTELGAVLEQLKQERARTEGELRQLQEAIDALNEVAKRRATTSPKNRLSAAARERIAAAQRARWAKVREKKGKKPA
jgi:hypothetical protein